MAKIVFALLALCGLLVGKASFAACSSYAGQVSINEYNFGNNFVELKVLDPAVLSATNDFAGWTLSLYNKQSSPATRSVKDALTNPSCGEDSPYLNYSFASGEVGSNAAVVLKDATGNEVDLLRVGQNSLPNFYASSCSAFPLDTNAPLLGSSGSKDVARLADGTGNWVISPGTGSNSRQTPCASNNEVLQKTAFPLVVSIGQNVTFTVTVTNTANSASGFWVFDDLPAGFQLLSANPSHGVWTSWLQSWFFSLEPGETATLTMIARATQAGSITNTASILGSDVPAASATISVIASGADRFDVVEPGANARTRIYTKLSGVGFSLDVLALDTTGSLQQSYTGTVAVELVDASSGACATMTSLQNLATYTFTGAGAGRDNGRKTLSFNHASGARNARVRIVESGSSRTSCSTDAFAIRPSAFGVASTANADASGVSTTATPVVKAGTPFTLTATALAGYDGTPRIGSSSLAAHAGAPAIGSLTGTFSAASFADGRATASLAYGEVGYFRLGANGVYDDSFTAVDQPDDCTNDFSNSLVGGKYGCKFGNPSLTAYFGRFIPDHFALVPGSLIDRADINTGSTETCASSFTYMGEDLKTLFTLVAQRAGCSNPADPACTTQDYVGGHAKFVLGTWSNYQFSATSGTAQEGTASPSGTWTEGRAEVTATHRRQRPPIPAEPDTAFVIRAQPQYTDGGEEIRLAAAMAVHTGTTEMRFGRLRLNNAYGSELLPLPVPITLQYWRASAGGFVTNTEDTCTTINAKSIAMDTWGGNLAACETRITTGTPLSARLSAPGSGNAGWTTLRVNLSATESGNTCIGAATEAASTEKKPYLQGNWGPGAGYDKDPVARATFGLHKKTDGFIYMRENY